MRVRGIMYQAVLWTMLATTMLAACTSWKVQSVSPEQLIAAEQPSTVRVLLQDGSRVVVHSPRISADSLLGVTARKPTSIPLANISEVAVQRVSALKLFVGVGAVAFVAYLAVFLYVREVAGAAGCGPLLADLVAPTAATA